MPAFETLESLQSSLEPLEALRGEHSQLESWVNESFRALEKLHGELTDWQSELARKQTELDLREDALEKCHLEGEDLDGKVEQWKHELGDARREIEQLEDENSEQLQELENLERRQAVLEAELRVASQRTEEISATLEVERAQASEEHEVWRTEFQQLRRLLEKHCSMLAVHLGEAPHAELDEAFESSVDLDPASRSAALRRKAHSRRAAKNRKHREGEDTTS